MTIIAVKDGIMAADSFSFSGGVGFPSAFPKITRGPRGLLGMAGGVNDCWAVSEWWSRDCTGDQPSLLKDNDGIVGLILKLDGTLWFIDDRLRPHPTTGPAAVGNNDAATFCEGALFSGMSAEEAVKLTIKHCAYAGGDVQVERIYDATPDRVAREKQFDLNQVRLRLASLEIDVGRLKRESDINGWETR
jgi:hypothetical protein